MDHSAMYALDARSSGATRRRLCCAESDPFLNDQFTLFRQNPVNPHQAYLASMVMVSLWDERYPKQPMQTWHHGLKHSPTFLDVAAVLPSQNVPHDLYLTLGSQRSREIAVLSVSQESTSLQPVSLLPPWHLSKPCDFTKQLEYQGCQVEEAIRKRTTAPLIGACVVTCSGGSLSALQLTSFGDLFCQDFVMDGLEQLAIRGSCKFGLGSDLMAVSEIQDRVQAWVDLAKVVPIQDEDESFVKFRTIPCCKEQLGLPNERQETTVVGEHMEENHNHSLRRKELEDLILRARAQKRTIHYSEWNRALGGGGDNNTNGAKGLEGGREVDDLVKTLDDVHLTNLDKTGMRYLKEWTETTEDVSDVGQQPEPTGDTSFTGSPQDSNSIQKERARAARVKPPVEAVIIHDDDLHTGFSQEATDSLSLEARTSCHQAELDANWVANDGDDYHFQSQTSVAGEASRRPGRPGKQALKRKRRVSDGF